MELAASAGPDFTAALIYQHDIPAPPLYPSTSVLLDSAAGGVTATMPQMRQQALLSCIRAALDPHGESIKLISDCVHAGGTVAGANQALMKLDIRWRAPDAPTDFGGKSAALYSKIWPVELSVDAYTSHYNTVVSLATEIGHNPNDESNTSQNIRSAWWRVIAEPPKTSPYYEAAREARVVTGQRSTTVVHRQEWLQAMCRAVALMVAADKGVSPKGIVRQPQVRFGGIQPGEVVPADEPPFWQVDAMRMVSPGGPGASMAPHRRCPRCPLDAAGQPTMHPPTKLPMHQSV